MTNENKALKSQIIAWEDGDVREGDIFRHWLVSLEDGRSEHRFQRLSRGNPCGISPAQIARDYTYQGRWGGSWNNMSGMPLPCLRIHGDQAIPVTEAVALGSISKQSM